MPPSDNLLQQAIDRFWETVPPTWNRIRGRIRSSAAESFGISVEQFHILRHIRKGFRTVSHLAEERLISRPAASQIVDTLVGKGLVERCQSSEDRRRVDLELSESGDALLNAIFQQNRLWMQTRLAVLDEDELNRLMDGLAILHKAFGESENIS
jgi:MarR family 2-MHQ and catechol resistance regulon transcriptional repressor